jgi:hypothetical protein
MGRHGRFSVRRARWITVLVALVAGRCSTPIEPTPVSTVELTVNSSRVEAGEELRLTAVVRNAGVLPDTLAYAWSVSPAAGVFVGSGAQVSWRAPGRQKTPNLYELGVVVRERFTSMHGVFERPLSASSVTVHYNDSSAEATRLASQFLSDFGTFSVSPEQCVRNFSDRCRGKQEELGQIQGNRANYHILSSTFTATTISFDASRTSGIVEGPCVFEDTPNFGPDAGRRERVSGTCVMTTVYENFQWRLCDSHFNPPFDQRFESLRYRVPGRASTQ